MTATAHPTPDMPATTAPQAAEAGSSTAPIVWAIPTDHPAFAGHFPGQPLLPGALLVAEALEAALGRPDLAALLGPTPTLTLTQAKFLAPVLPGSILSLRLTPTAGGRLGFEISCDARVAASGQFGAVAASLRPDRPSGHEPAGPPQGRIPECEARRYFSEPAGPPQGRIP